MIVKLLLAQMGLGKYLPGFGKKERLSPMAVERQKFADEVKDQLLKLKEKGLSIPVFTL